MTTVRLSLVSHTNVGKTTLARTLLGRDIGEVRDAPHVTEFAEMHVLVRAPDGSELQLWDTPGFGDSVRLVRRLRGSATPLGWFLSQVWDRWRDRPFWATQQALRHVRDESDVVLYLVNAAEPPAAAGYVAPEMDLLAWVGKPVLVLLNQLGAPRAAADEAAEVEAWRAQLAPHAHVKAVLPLDAFARCWVQEGALLQAIDAALGGGRLAPLVAEWERRNGERFDAAMAELAAGLARTAATRVPLEGRGWLVRRDEGAAARAALAEALALEVQAGTARLLALHGIAGDAGREILDRVAALVDVRERLDEGRAAIVGGVVTGALAGLKADLASGGLTLGGGLIAGSLLGALGAAGLARGLNVVRGSGQAGWNADAAGPLAEAALLRYLAVAHFGRGRGQWVQGEAPPHWPAVVRDALAPEAGALAAAWKAAAAPGADPATAAPALQAPLARAARVALAQLYPGVLRSESAS